MAKDAETTQNNPSSRKHSGKDEAFCPLNVLVNCAGGGVRRALVPAGYQTPLGDVGTLGKEHNHAKKGR